MNYYSFKIKNNHFLVDVHSSSVFKIDNLIHKILSYYETNDLNNIIEIMSAKYNVNDISNAFTKLNEMRNLGYFKNANNSALYQEQNRIQRYVLSLYSTHRCNLRCHYCFSNRDRDIYHQKNEMNMSEKIAKKAVDFLINELAIGDATCRVSFTAGGEPLLNFNLFLLIKDYCVKREQEIGKKIPCSLTTNGTLLSPEILNKLENMKQKINISIDGNKEIHDSMRCFPSGKGSFDCILPKIREAMRKDLIRCACVTYTPIKTDFVKIITFLVDIGFTVIVMKPARLPHNSPYAITLQNVKTITEEYEKLAEFLLNKTTEGKTKYLESILNMGDFFGRFLIRILFQVKLGYRCNAGRSEFNVTATGDLYPCAPFAAIKKWKLGSIFKGIDKSKQFAFLEKTKIDKKSSCSKCWARYFCGGGCYHSAYLSNKKIDKPDVAECKLVKYLIKLSIWMWVLIGEKHPELIIKFKESIIKNLNNR